MDIDGVAAIVTGGGSGLGAATARLLAARGAKVAIFDRDPGHLQPTRRVTHCGEQLADDDRGPLGGRLCTTLVYAGLNCLDGLLQGQSCREVLFRCPPQLGIDDIVAGEIKD